MTGSRAPLTDLIKLPSPETADFGPKAPIEANNDDLVPTLEPAVVFNKSFLSNPVIPVAMLEAGLTLRVISAYEATEEAVLIAVLLAVLSPAETPQ